MHFTINGDLPDRGRVERAVQLIVDLPRPVRQCSRDKGGNRRKIAAQCGIRRRATESFGIFFRDEPGRKLA